MSVSKEMLKHIIVFFFFLAAAAYITYPLIFHLTNYSPDLVDGSYITWILNWNIHALTNNIPNIFQGNIYYPYEYVLSFSDLHLTSSLIGLIPVKIFGEPLLAYNINLLLGFVLLGFCTYLLVFYLTSDRAAAITSGTIFAFSTFLLLKLGHLQVLTIYWIPLCLLFYFIYINTKKFKFFLISMSMFYLQFINSFMPAYFLLFILLFLTFFEIWKNKKPLSIFVNKRTVTSLIILILLCIPIIYPYYHTSYVNNYVRDIREAIHTANRPEFLLLSYGRSHLGELLYSIFYQNPKPPYYDGYRGFVSLILSFFVIIYLFLKRKKPKYFSFFTIAAISTYIISLGPALQWGGHVIKTPIIFPLPYALLYYLAPGFKGFRNSGRWEVYEIFVFCIAIGLLLAFLLKNSQKKWLINILLIFLVLAEFKPPIKYYKLPTRDEIPPIYKYLQTTPDIVITEFPLYNWDMLPYSLDENKRQYFSSFHFKKTVNGGGGFSPYPWQGFVRYTMSEFPNDFALDRLKKIGVQYIIVHNKEYDLLYKEKFSLNEKRIPNSRMIKETLAKSKKIEFIKSFDSDSFYKLLD